jgi:F0F1-type ATP synthase delta subunit
MIKLIKPENDFEKKVIDNTSYNEETEENLNEIKNILDNEDSINNLLTSPTSKYRSSITKEFIKNLIILCLYPN